MPLGIKYRVKNGDGSISTVRTISIGVDGGEVVIPTVLKGRVVSDEEAIQHYERTGANFGTFATPEEATAFAEELHNRHARELEREGRSSDFAPKGIEGERITSSYRTPERNRAVGGVANSYHTRKGSDGRALARDSVPPPGMSMARYAEILRQQNPHLEVINEGDHVHMEPR
ncbi:D-Ala-D-Ala carboxypeptidase family metallohydrolase [Sphingorhabdus sp. SMR4y]|uniref:D-Ala-D-Ala carboxypeptidase family metallohydrolase n=1 Tax=Sphingorhabdus sp. SMR4y TaxID=2584094 RepID=UPI000B5C95EA|nr:D-Ala-D-Ala carboxypeptidase family metallohydrolase [Sphingorhabdus sp. SMR4y]